MTIYSIAWVILLAFRMQGIVLPPSLTSSDCITVAEQRRLTAEQKIENRIKRYREISERLHKAVETAAQKQKFEEVPGLLKCWIEVLAVSLKDVEENINRKKKSGALIDYEIAIRKSILDMEDVQIKAPYSQQADFDAWIAQATTTRKKFVDILFQR